jgi:hypothetical protein
MKKVTVFILLILIVVIGVVAVQSNSSTGESAVVETSISGNPYKMVDPNGTIVDVNIVEDEIATCEELLPYMSDIINIRFDDPQPEYEVLEDTFYVSGSVVTVKLKYDGKTMVVVLDNDKRYINCREG